jgi:glycosyltransferase involved in cell wall biosynthesis
MARGDDWMMALAAEWQGEPRVVKKPICVVLVIDDLEYGGAQRQVIELANNMNQDRFDVQVCTLSDYVPLGRQLRDAQQRLHIIPKRNRVDFTVVPRLTHVLRSLQADIVHSYLFSADIASRLAGRLAGTKVIIGSERNADYSPGWKQRVAYRLTRRCVDLTIANSQAGASFNSRTFGQAISKYRVVYNGVDTARFRFQDPDTARRALGIPVDRRVVGVFASLKPQKNHAMLLHAFRKVLDRLPDTQLLLVGGELYGNMGGTGDYHAAMVRLIEELGIRRACTFLGNRNDVERVYPACDLTALSSLYEGTPNVLLESMACGVPIVATSVSDNSYVVKEGQTGFLVEVGDVAGMADRISTLLADDALRREMGRKANRWVVEEFSTKRLIENTEAIYLGAFNNRCGGGF